VVTPEPDWLLCEGPAAVARPKEGSVPFPSNRMHWTGEKVTLRQRLLESELSSFLVDEVWPQLENPVDQWLDIPTERYLATGEATAQVLSENGEVIDRDAETTDGEVRIKIDSAPLAAVV